MDLGLPPMQFLQKNCKFNYEIFVENVCYHTFHYYYDLSAIRFTQI